MGLGTQSIEMRGIHPCLVRWTRRAGTIQVDFCLALAALVSPLQNIIFLIAHFLLVPVAKQPGQPSPCWVACLCVSGLSCLSLFLRYGKDIFAFRYKH
jgi:hypothetical protein